MAIPGPTCNHFRYLNEQLFSLHRSNPFFEDFHFSLHWTENIIFQNLLSIYQIHILSDN